MIVRKSFSQFVKEATASSPTLDDLRSASAKATMAGPSKEAQALMSPRAKAFMGQSKLDAGIKAQQGVEAMKASMPSSTPTPLPTPNAEWAKANPKLAAAYTQRQQTRGTSQTDNPLMRDTRGSLPQPQPKAPTSQTTQAPTAPPQPKTSSPSLNPQQQDLYKQAYQNRNNPFAKGRIKSEFSKLTPEQQAAFRQYAKDQGHDWGNLI